MLNEVSTLTDQGRNFESELMKEVFKLLPGRSQVADIAISPTD